MALDMSRNDNMTERFEGAVELVLHMFNVGFIHCYPFAGRSEIRKW